MGWGCCGWLGAIGSAAGLAAWVVLARARVRIRMMRLVIFRGFGVWCGCGCNDTSGLFFNVL